MRIDRNDLPELLFKTLKAIGGEGTIIEVCKHFWDTYEQDLQARDTSYTREMPRS